MTDRVPNDVAAAVRRVRATPVWSWLRARLPESPAASPAAAARRRIADKASEDCCGLSDTGLVRDGNEDAFLVVPELGLYIVADGLGGHAAGEVASALAVEAAFDCLAADRPPDTSDARRLDAAFQAASDAVRRHGDAHRECADMATTLIVALIAGDRATIAHVGDVRAYLCRDGGLARLTNDHTLVGRLLRDGLLDEDEARRHPARNRLGLAIMGQPDIVADQVEVECRAGDCLLLCSDGLWEAVPHAEIAAVLSDPAPAFELATRLADKAIAAGGNDNITALIWRPHH